MADYKDIAGTKVQNFSSDPSDPLLGQVWYNTTSTTLKGCLLYTSPSPRDGLLSRMPSSA